MRQSLWFTASLLAIAAGATPVLAQDAAEGGTVEEVIVTAQRRAQNLQDVPLAVTALSPRQLEAAQIDDTTDLVRFTPSVTGGLNTATGSALSFFIRGLGSTEQIATFDVPVATYVDEIYFARQSVNAVSLFDVERVEVLRGPQGTLFGRNTTGGAVSITTRKPAAAFGGFVEGSYGSFDKWVARGSVDVPINDQLLTKVSAFYVDDKGYSRSLVTGERLNGEEAYGVRGAVTWLPNDKLRWDVSVDYVDQSKTTLGSSPVDPRYKLRTGLRYAECDDNAGDAYLATSTGNCARVRTGGLTSNLEYDFSFATLNFISGYRQNVQNFALDFFNGTGPRGGYVIANDIVNEQWSHELKLTGDTGRFNWVAGLFYLDESSKTNEIDYFGVLLADWRMDNTTESIAAYAQADIDLTDQLTLTLGGRYTHEEKTLAYTDGVKPSYPPGVVLALPPLASRPTSASVAARGIPLDQETSKFTPRVALTYEIDDDRLIYASATNGFKSGGWNTRVTNVNAVTIFGPEKAWSYELGARTEWLDKRLRLNGTFYHLQVEDLQLLSGVGGQFLTRNAGDMEATGFELDASAAVTEQLDVFISGSVSKSEYKNIPPFFGAGGIPCSATPEPAQCTTERDKLVRFPAHQLTMGVTYRQPVESLGGELTFNGSLNYQDDYWSSTYNDTPNVFLAPFGTTQPISRLLSRVPSTTLVNIGMKFEHQSGWEAALECSNCLKEYFATSSLFNIGYYNDPRRVTLRLRYNF